ncbi:hypothetical protein [Streptomyces nitrosporeus]|uniref:hypothetical protein n=1 Tax=Streptomyces nitrosporeus TaxID=28894 RepID=UPI0039A31642
MDEDARLVRDAMEYAAEGLGPLPDLVPGAVALGRRRRARTRAAVTAGTFGAATLAALGVVALTGQGPGSRGAATLHTGVAAPAAYRTPVEVTPSPGEDPAGRIDTLPPGERQRLRDFQQSAAVALDEALPSAVGTVRPLSAYADRYRGERHGDVFQIVFQVRPAGDEAARTCRDIPQKRMTCEERQLTEGVTAQVRSAAAGSPDTLSVSIAFGFGNSTVLLEVLPDEETGASAPVTGSQLLDGVRESGLLEVVRYADEHPVLKKQASVQGG